MGENRLWYCLRRQKFDMCRQILCGPGVSIGRGSKRFTPKARHQWKPSCSQSQSRSSRSIQNICVYPCVAEVRSNIRYTLVIYFIPAWFRSLAIRWMLLNRMQFKSTIISLNRISALITNWSVQGCWRGHVTIRIPKRLSTDRGAKKRGTAFMIHKASQISSYPNIGLMLAILGILL